MPSIGEFNVVQDFGGLRLKEGEMYRRVILCLYMREKRGIRLLTKEESQYTFRVWPA